jgi:hypothetical protein
MTIGFPGLKHWNTGQMSQSGGHGLSPDQTLSCPHKNVKCTSSICIELILSRNILYLIANKLFQ